MIQEFLPLAENALVLPLRINIDNLGYKAKPEGREIGKLSNRLKRKESVVEIFGISDILEAVCQGKTITAGEMANTKESGWMGQRLFVFDIDNDTKTLPKLTPSDVEDLLANNGLPLSFAYWTFSSTPEHPKFRIAALCNEVVTDPNIARQIISGIMSVFPSAQELDDNGKVRTASPIDLACKNLDRMFLGTNKGIVEGIGGTETFAKETALALYQKEQEKKKAITRQYVPPRQTSPPGSFDLEAAIKAFNLLEYILGTTNSRNSGASGGRVTLNPCPLCGHKDDFNVYTETNSYKCFSSSNGSGGNIINYLQEKHGVDKKAAVERFKYEICGVDKEAERKAWKESRKKLKIIKMQEKAHLLTADGAGMNAARTSNGSGNNNNILSRPGQDYFKAHFLPANPGFIKINPFETDISGKRLYDWNDIGMGYIFADAYKNISRYVPEADIWYIYDGRVWKPDVGGVGVAEQAKYIIEYLLDARKLIEDDDRRNAWVEFIIKRAKSYARDIMIKDARSVYPVSIKEFDKDPYLLNCLNATVDLKNHISREHSPDDFFSKTAAIIYDPDAKCDRWERFVGEIMQNNGDTAAFLQKSLGYALTGGTSEECFFILYGSTTRNGKGTVMETMLNLLGDYGRTAQPETVAQKQTAVGGRPTEDIARLKGARFVNMSEPDKGLRLNAALVKQMTGGDTITARFLHQNSFEFRPEYKLFINTNHLPRISDDSIFASGRVKLIPFERHFEEHEQDKNLKALFRQPENVSGIFNWLVEGLRLMQSEGLEPPDSVKSATARYREDSDIIGQFVNECLISVPSHKVTIKDVHNAYSEWCGEHGFSPFNSHNLTSELRKKGYTVKNSDFNRVYLFDFGIAPASNTEIPPEFL